MTKGRGRRKVIAYDVVSFNYMILTWRNLSWFPGDHTVTLGVTGSGGYCLIFMRLDSRCPERSWFWTESASVPPISPTLAKTKVATAAPPSHIHMTWPCWARLGWSATLPVPLPWLSSWDTSFSPCELGKGSTDVCAWVHHTLVRDALAKPLRGHRPTPAPEIAMGLPW